MRKTDRPSRLLPIAIVFTGVLLASASISEADLQSSGLSKPLIVAFIGDQGSGEGARSVLNLIKAEGADLVFPQGEFDCDDDPNTWDHMITSILGADFPYFASVGNHDVDRYCGADGHQAKRQGRLSKVGSARCVGDLGAQSACIFKGLLFILSGVGTIPDQLNDPKHVALIQDQLAQHGSIWKICSWHKNQRDMQLGRKRDEVGWDPYEACRRGGAIVANGHEHSYARTHLMDSFESLSVASMASALRLEDKEKALRSCPAWADTASENRIETGLGGQSFTPPTRMPITEPFSVSFSLMAIRAEQAAISKTLMAK